MRPQHHLSPAAIFRMPAAIAAATGMGLVAALLGEGWWDAASWLGLAIPVLAIAWALRHRRA